MPNLRAHCVISKERTGYDFKNLHEWIDKPYKELGYNHRLKRHAYNKKEENFIKDYWEKKKGKGWGKKAVVEWLFHIAVDNLETAFKKAKNTYKRGNAYNFFRFGMSPKSKFIFFDFERLDEEELKDEFDDVYESED